MDSSPALGDLDGDGKLEVVVGSHDDKIYALNHDGTNVPGWPITTGGSVFSSPALGDLDNDGLVEIVVGSNDNKIYAFNEIGSYDESHFPWPMFHHDERNTGLYTQNRYVTSLIPIKLLSLTPRPTGMTLFIIIGVAVGAIAIVAVVIILKKRR